MKVISGLKGIFKEPIYLFTISSFLLIWCLIIINTYLKNSWLWLTILMLGGGILFSLLAVFILSFFISITKLKFYIFLILLITGFIVAFFLLDSIYFPTSDIFFIIPLFANQIFTAFFAFKFCIDSTTKMDDYLYRKEKSRVITRPLEFIIFGFLTWWIVRLTLNFFSHTPTQLFRAIIQIFQVIFWVDFILMIVVILRLLITRNFIANITFFFLLTFFYVLYIFLDFIFGVFYSTESGDFTYIILSFIIDVLLFLYMIGTVYSRIEYIQDKLKFIKLDTIALFLILMRIYVQLSKIVPRTFFPEVQILQAGGLLFIFIIFTLIFGIHSIITHKPHIEKKE